MLRQLRAEMLANAFISPGMPVSGATPPQPVLSIVVIMDAPTIWDRRCDDWADAEDCNGAV